MQTDFQDYLRSRKPGLDEAFREQLSSLLGNVPLKGNEVLLGALGEGKKIRGCLTCLISEALGGSLKEAMPRAVAVELIQAATLIHDDFVDQDTTRRNQPAVWTLEGARQAVLIGDVIFATAIQMMNDLGREDGLAVSRAIVQVARGALHEPLDPLAVAVEIESDRVNEKWYEGIIHLKTGILFGTACQLGALGAKAERKLGTISYRYGLRVGEAYQIADDLKEVEQHLAGRPLHQGQMAFLAPALLHFVPDQRWLVLERLKGKGQSGEDVAGEYFRAAAILMEKEIERRLQEAVSEIMENFPDNEYRAVVRQAPRDLIGIFNAS
jgi:geranylgeranyl pyrophosphate synthase